MSLMTIAAIACGTIYVVVSPPTPVIKRTESKPPAVLLPYEQQVARPREVPGQPQTDVPQEPAVAPADTTPAATAPAKAAPDEAAAPKPEVQATAPAEDAGTPYGGTQENAARLEGAGVPPAGGASAEDGAAMPPDDGDAPDQGAMTPDDGSGQYDVTAVPSAAPPPGAPYGDAQRGGPYGPPPYGPPPNGAYGPPPNGPYGQAPDGAAQGAPNGASEEWVQVLVSGAGMYGTASDDAPMLFAFPYGRRLRVVSHYEGWVEVTDPQSATTGWMKAGHLAAVTSPQAPSQQVDAGYQDEQQGWFRRRRGGIADIISRALGGGN